VLLENIAGEHVLLEQAAAIGAALREPLMIMDRNLAPTVSIGIALSTPEHTRPETLLGEADVAMYHAKTAGKARCALFRPEMARTTLDRMELEQDLRLALDRGELWVAYQPIVALASGSMIELEALVRWQHPVRGLIPPSTFIPLAEETGLIIPIGGWVLAQACRQTRRWQESTPAAAGLVVSVNLSPRQFQQPGLVDDVARILRETGLAPEHLKLEVTETAMMHDTEAAVGILRELKELGIHLAIDDFGTGYSSLAYLKSLPLDVLKIDRSFVDGLGRESEDTAIVETIVALARTLNLTITAEGIETAEQARQLRDIRCERGQGYYFARPLNVDAVSALLAAPAVLQDMDALTDAARADAA
jgi:EAL domain-containing protein (putative c-di-GMP-specific phosphodiesterase class I)